MEAVATAGVEVLVQNLINFLKEEYSLLRGLEEDAGKLQETLEMVQAYLSGAETKSITDDAVKMWLRKLEAVAFDAYYVLDELNYHFVYKKARKMDALNPNPKLKNKVLSCFSSCSSSSTRFSRRSKMAHAIKHINADFESVNKKATNLGLQLILANSLPAVADTSDETDSLSLDPIFIGRDDDVPILVDMLTQTHPEEDKPMFSIVALVGMGGMGKTTLTKKVIHHERVKARFGSLLWVHVSQTFDPIILFKKILSTFPSQGGDECQSKEAILRKLQDALKEKTYLLVLDDVWNEDVPKWEDFINSMSGVTSTMGNGIIITTRSQKVASIVNPLQYTLRGLSDDDCWSIIREKAFDGNEEVPPQFEIIGKKIAEACRGLPLAANVVGGVLRRCKSEEEWHSISINCLTDAEGAERIKKILKLSYNYLPSPSLKKCFAYCSIFPKGDWIIKHRVIEQWMAEGFLQPDKRNEMEDVGNKFFNVLLHNSLLQVAWRDEYGNVEGCVMHDLVHDLASSVLSNNNADGSTPIRYMFLEVESSHISKEVAKQLRTLILKSGTSNTTFSDFQCLHNLTLDDDNITELSNSIRELIHLRYLDISNTCIKDLPEWIGELSHLQTLRLSRVSSSQKLANTLKYLVNLRHLYIKDVELPAEIGRLTSLQTLPCFKVGEEKGYHIEELGNLKNLKEKLVITNLERVCDKEEALKANILQKQHLSELQFEWGLDCWGERNDESVLEGLKPHANLKELSIDGYKGIKFPTWLRGEPQGSCLPLHNLIQIKLESCSECEEITLDHLPNLRSLFIRELKSLKCLSKMFFYNHRKLSYLDICYCDMLEALPDGLDTLNSLKGLRIVGCGNLKSMGNPSCGGGENQGILRELRISNCGELMELPRQMLELWGPTIEELELEGLRSLKNLPMLVDCMAKSSTRLTTLIIMGVPKLMPAGSVESWNLGSLKTLMIDVSEEWSRENCVGINETVNGILEGCCNSLEWLILRGVENWEWLPQSIQRLTSLYWLELKNIGIEELPQWFGNLSALKMLDLYGCTKLRCLPSVDAFKPLTKLTMLEIKNCPKLSIDSEWRNHPNLKIKVDGDRI
ncbi:putative disease resistance protein RGA1 [Salvia splendens]|uniref:putative disease resistance protein RGA1 n=1 Tax=Salvia splendens TaxID=180675 RepID=UPI001C266C00|nr:putative disease resistance protein RGA1 [Salvia splendens]